VKTVTLAASARQVELWGRADVTTLRRFLERLGQELHPELRAATRAATRLAAREALGAHPLSPGLAELFERSAGERAALTRSVDAALGELCAAGATPADLRATGTRTGRRLADLLAAVGATLADARMIDGRAAIDPRAIDGAPAEIVPDAIDVRGLARFDRGALEALVALHARARARRGRGLVVHLCRFDDPVDAMGRIAGALERRFGGESDAPEIAWHEARPPERSAVLVARSAQAEARGVVRAVADALARGAPPERVAVVVPPQSAGWTAALGDAFTEARLPFSEPYGRGALAAPEARAVLDLAAMAARGVTRDGLVELLRLPGIHAGSLVGEQSEREAAAKAGELAACLRQLPLMRDPTGGAFVEAVRAARPDRAWMATAVERLVDSIGEIGRARGLVELGARLVDLAHRLRLGEPSANEIGHALRRESAGRSPSDLGALEAIGQGAVAVRAVLRTARDLGEAAAALGAGGGWTATDLHAELELATAAALTSRAVPAGAVRICEPREILGAEHDLVVVTRLAGAAYAPPSGRSLLDDTTRSLLPEARRPAGRDDLADACAAELAWAGLCADAVLLSHATADEEGREAEAPHPMLAQALALGATCRIEPASRVHPRASVLSARSAELSALAAGARPADTIAARVAAETERSAFFLRGATLPGAHSGAVPAALAPLLARRFGATAEAPVPVTSIEHAAACPFRAFAIRVLCVQPAEDPSDPLGPRERGILAHRALHAVFEADRELPPSTPVGLRLAHAAEVAAAAVRLEEPGGPLRREGKRRVVAEVVDVLADDLARADRELSFQLAERDFGAGREPPWGPLELPAAGGEPVYVDGRIDRIDATADFSRARVIDYKTSRRLPSTKQLGVTAFQLPLYAEVAARLGPVEVEVGYVAVGGRGSSSAGVVLDRETAARAAARAAEIVAAIRSGLVPPAPAHPASCRRCPARGVCRKPAVVPMTDDGDRGPE
jgi:RecB family exonuclease